MSIKTVAVLKESELEDGQMFVNVDHLCSTLTLRYRKEVTFEGEGRVLLSRIGNKIHATSAFCTHYGAPLAKGVLTSDGRVVWCVQPILKYGL